MTRSAAVHQLTGHLELSTAGGAFLGDTRVRLLELIDRHGSISEAARQLPMSYKAAWDAVDAMSQLAERALVERSAGGRAGGGTRLTPHGRRLVAMYRAVEAEYQRALASLAGRLDDVGRGERADFRRLLRRLSLRTSARNQFVGSVCGVHGGPVDFEVRVRVDEGLELVVVVTPDSAAQLELALGSEVVVLVKAPAMQLHAEAPAPGAIANRLWGKVVRVVGGPSHAEVVVDLGGARSVVAVVPRATVEALALAPGMRVCAAFPASAPILAVIE
jgi:molybdate transport system regulatory protein